MAQVESRTMERVIKEIEHLSSLPQVVSKVMAMTDSNNINAVEVSKAMDQSLSSKVLKVANSAYYGARFSRQVNNVHHAIMIIGFDAVKEIILTTSFFHTFKDAQEVVILQPLWKHSLECAFAARRLAWAFRYEGMDEAYLVGLIHDIGKLVIYQYFPEQFKAITNATGGRDNWELEMEKKLLGMTHAWIGGKVAQNWSFPEALVEVISFHHGGSHQLNPKLGRILYLADRYVTGLVEFQGLVEEFKKAGMSHPPNWKGEDLERVEKMLQDEMKKGVCMFQSSPCA